MSLFRIGIGLLVVGLLPPPQSIRPVLIGIGVVHAQTAENALTAAARLGNTAKVRALLAKGVNVNARDSYGMTALIYAAGATGRGDAEIVKMLLNAGAEVNVKAYRPRDKELVRLEGMTPLMAAATAGDAQITKILLRAGAAVNARDPEGFTALMFAVTGNFPDEVESKGV